MACCKILLQHCEPVEAAPSNTAVSSPQVHLLLNHPERLLRPVAGTGEAAVNTGQKALLLLALSYQRGADRQSKVSGSEVRHPGRDRSSRITERGRGAGPQPEAGRGRGGRS